MRKRSEVKAAKAVDAAEQAVGNATAALDTALAQTTADHRTPLEFPTAHKPRLKRAREDVRRITETLFVTDVHAEWEKLQAALSLGEKRSEHAHAQAALDRAATYAYRAHRLYLTARALREEWELENEAIFAAYWNKAERELQAEKDAGRRNKTITDADVKARVATIDPEGYQFQEKKRRDLEFTVKSLERLAEIWLGRQRDLQALVGKMRG